MLLRLLSHYQGHQSLLLLFTSSPCCLSQFPLRISYQYVVREHVTLHVVLASSTLGESTVASLDSDFSLTHALICVLLTSTSEQ